MRGIALVLTFLALALLAPTGAHAWPNTALGRVEALAAVQALDIELLTHDSATATLERWCAAHKLAPLAKITARRDKAAETPAPPEARAALQVGSEEPVRHRRVQLVCGARVLSEADNYYLPARLTSAMNRTLDETETPFGRAVAALDFRRRTISAELLFRPLAEGWETAAVAPTGRGGMLEIPAHVIEHRAVLSTPDGRPFSLVIERYTRETLGFQPPAGR